MRREATAGVSGGRHRGGEPPPGAGADGDGPGGGGGQHHPAALALAEIPERDVDVVFLDIEMPGLDGFDAAGAAPGKDAGGLRHGTRAVRAASL